MAEHTTEERQAWFLRDIHAVYEDHGLALGHEDTHGAFVIVPWDKEHDDWIMDASWGYPPGHPWANRNGPLNVDTGDAL